MEEKSLKCASCGASLKAEEKYCSYCGSANAGYKEKQIKDVEIPKNEHDDSDFDDMLGGFLGGVLLGGTMRHMGRSFNRRHPRR